MSKQITLIKAVFFSSIFFMGLFLTYQQVFGAQLDQEIVRYYASDMIPHIEFVKQYFDDTKYIPHPLWHILVKGFSVICGLSIEYSAAFVSSSILLLWSVLIYYTDKTLLLDTLQTQTALRKEIVILLLTFFIYTVGPLVLPFYSNLIYKGVGSPNIWHNVTLWMVKPLALLSMLFAVWGMQKQKLLYYGYAIVATLLSIYAKPSFIIIFLPAIYLLMIDRRYISKSNLYFIASLTLFSILILFYQYTHTYSNNTDGGIIIDIFGVWSLGTNSILISISLALAFPLLFYILYPESSKNDLLLLSWLQVLFGIILYAVFAEKGSHYSHGNFGWSYRIALSMLYLFSIIEFCKSFYILNLWKRSSLLILLILQVAIGVYYLVHVLEGQNPIYIGVFI